MSVEKKNVKMHFKTGNSGKTYSGRNEAVSTHYMRAMRSNKIESQRPVEEV